ncbi:GxxExxY protein [Limihaloglobus sulfuriphilus]|uniref:GxxExxY protein n=1 Tax=Limihaloglobus sulfuriphilus TaxID=1851148 RepID=A0A1R7T693_9BACT|nr:GxxExxY protein [Limihaloglobus sulfuriphilus]AQQ72533.1 GxxExxY protein [Limihaloglobus sulfuriphilus]
MAKVNKNIQFSELSNRVIGCAIDVHKSLGPGLLESAYQQCLCHEFRLNNIKFEREKPLAVNYKGFHLDCGYRIDIVVENQIIIELKAIDLIKPIHEAQIISYMKLSGLRQGFLINFNVPILKDGLSSFVI